MGDGVDSDVFDGGTISEVNGLIKHVLSLSNHERFLREWQASSLYFTLPVFIGSDPGRRTNKQRKGASRRIIRRSWP